MSMISNRPVISLGRRSDSVCRRGADSDAQLALNDEVLPPGYGPSLRVHPSNAEGFYVLDGALTVQLGGS
jgi:mannose-6-phosphate isomerase-like protein (cupin superfamily)